MVGDGVAQAGRTRLRRARRRSRMPGAIAEYSADYSAHAAVETGRTRVCAEALRSLAAGGLAPGGLHQQAGSGGPHVLAALGLARFFAAVGGGDSFPVRKPDPAHLLATLRPPAASRRTR